MDTKNNNIVYLITQFPDFDPDHKIKQSHKIYTFPDAVLLNGIKLYYLLYKIPTKISNHFESRYRVMNSNNYEYFISFLCDQYDSSTKKFEPALFDADIRKKFIPIFNTKNTLTDWCERFAIISLAEKIIPEYSQYIKSFLNWMDKPSFSHPKKENTYETICNDIYYLCNSFPFRIIDAVYLKIGKPTDTIRIKAFIEYILKKKCYYVEEHIVTKLIVKNLGFTERCDIESVLNYLYKIPMWFYKTNDIADGKNAIVYLHESYYTHETLIKKYIENINHQINTNMIQQIRKKNDEQSIAIQTILSHGFSIITGGAGTGKTTLIQKLCEILFKNHHQQKFCVLSPTGTACDIVRKRLSHSVKGIITEDNSKIFEDDNNFVMTIESFIMRHMCGKKIPNLANIIIDEVSMVSINTFGHLVKILQTYNTIKRLTIIGDKNQLPSIDVGNLLYSLLNCDIYTQKKINDKQRLIIPTNHKLPICELKINHRQDKSGQFIIPLANNIIAHDVESVLCFKNEHYERITDISKTFQIIDTFIQNNTPNKKMDNHMILIHTKKGQYGTNIINNYIDKKLMPTDSKIGSRVICHSNGYYGNDHEYIANGTIFYVTEYNDITVKLQLDDPVYTNVITIYTEEYRNHFNLCWCMTIHKSQGKEFDNLLVILPTTSEFILSTNLLYTAITRCKKNLTLIASDNILTKCINTPILQYPSYLELRDKYLKKINIPKHNINSSKKICIDTIANNVPIYPVNDPLEFDIDPMI